MNASVRLRIRGVVQGVGYRASAHHEAERLGLSGWVRNRADGSVETYALGSREAVAAYEAWCARGPRGGRVTAVEVLERRDEVEAGAAGAGFAIRPTE